MGVLDEQDARFGVEVVGVEGVVGRVVGVVEFLAAALPGVTAVGDALGRAVLDTGVISRPVAALIQVTSFLLFCFGLFSRRLVFMCS